MIDEMRAGFGETSGPASGRSSTSCQAPGIAASRSLLRAVIFDLDGVLVNSFHVMRQAFAIAYAEVAGNGEAPFEEYSRHLGRFFPDIMDLMGLPREMEGPFTRESYRLAGEVQIYGGVLAMLQDLRMGGLRLAVATGKAGDRARSLLELLGMRDFFECVIGGDEVVRSKPAPDMVLRALDLLGVGPHEVLVIGDAPTDLISARSAGVAAAAAVWGDCDIHSLLAQRPDAVLYSPGEIPAFCWGWSTRVRLPGQLPGRSFRDLDS